MGYNYNNRDLMNYRDYNTGLAASLQPAERNPFILAVEHSLRTGFSRSLYEATTDFMDETFGSPTYVTPEQANKKYGISGLDDSITENRARYISGIKSIDQYFNHQIKLQDSPISSFTGYVASIILDPSALALYSLPPYAVLRGAILIGKGNKLLSFINKTNPLTKKIGGLKHFARKSAVFAVPEATVDIGMTKIRKSLLGEDLNASDYALSAILGVVAGGLFPSKFLKIKSVRKIPPAPLSPMKILAGSPPKMLEMPKIKKANMQLRSPSKNVLNEWINGSLYNDTHESILETIKSSKNPISYDVFDQWNQAKNLDYLSLYQSGYLKPFISDSLSRRYDDLMDQIYNPRHRFTDVGDFMRIISTDNTSKSKYMFIVKGNKDIDQLSHLTEVDVNRINGLFISRIVKDMISRISIPKKVIKELSFADNSSLSSLNSEVKRLQKNLGNYIDNTPEEWIPNHLKKGLDNLFEEQGEAFAKDVSFDDIFTNIDWLNLLPPNIKNDLISVISKVNDNALTSLVKLEIPSYTINKDRIKELMRIYTQMKEMKDALTYSAINNSDALKFFDTLDDAFPNNTPSYIQAMRYIKDRIALQAKEKRLFPVKPPRSRYDDLFQRINEGEILIEIQEPKAEIIKNIIKTDASKPKKAKAVLKKKKKVK